MIMELLAKIGAEPVSAERFLEFQNPNLKLQIALHSKQNLGQLKAKTIEGYKLLQNQIERGLSAKASRMAKNESLDHDSE